MDVLLQNKSTLLLALGVAMMIFILMRRWQRYFRRPQRSGKPVRPAARSGGVDVQQPLMDAPPEIIRWHIEMEETARELKAELDTRIAVLQRLVLDARAQADRLEAITERIDAPDEHATAPPA